MLDIQNLPKLWARPYFAGAPVKYGHLLKFYDRTPWVFFEENPLVGLYF